MEKLLSNKGQIFSIDFAIAIFLFVTVVSSLMVNRNLMLSKINRQEEVIERMRLEAIFDSLLLQPGEPENWNLDNVEVIGLVNEANELNGTKLLLFKDMNYNRTQRLLGIEDMFYFEVSKNGTVVNYSNTKLMKGNKNWEGANDITVLRGTGFLDGSLVKLKMVKW